MNPLIAASVLAVVLMLGIATFHLVVTLRQTRRTAFALEEFLTGTRPKIEETADHLNAILRRTDGVMATVEQGVARFAPRPRQSGALMDSVMRALSTVSAIVEGANQITALFFQKSDTTKEGTHGKQ